MSNVPVRKRNESKVQFIDTARELVVHTLHYTKKLPKAAMFLITKDIADLSREIYRCVVTANRFYPNTERDRDERYKLFKRALGCIDTMDCFLGIARDSYGSSGISDYGWVHWGELLFKEADLIRKVLASDEKALAAARGESSEGDAGTGSGSTV